MKLKKMIDNMYSLDVDYLIEVAYGSVGVTTEQRENYIKVFNILKDMTPGKSNYTVYVEKNISLPPKFEVRYDVYGVLPSEPYVVYALDHEGWADWLDMEVIGIGDLKPDQIVAHIIDKMTFFGYSNGEVKKCLKEY